MKGRLRSSLNVSVGVNGQFDGEIEAKKVMISGRVDGTIDAERLEIVSTGRVTGEIKVTELVIEPGGQFSGTSQIKEAGESAPRQLTYTSSAQQPTEVNDTDNGSDSDKDASLRVDPSIAVLTNPGLSPKRVICPAPPVFRMQFATCFQPYK